MRLCAVSFVFLAVLQFATAVDDGLWQYWISGAGCLLTVWGCWRLGGALRHVKITEPPPTRAALRTPEAVRWALVALAGIAAVTIAMWAVG